MDRRISTGTWTAAFPAGPLHSIAIRRRNGSALCESGRQSILLRTPRALFEPTLLTRARWCAGPKETLCCAASDATGRWKAKIELSPSVHGLRFRARFTAPEPLWLAEWTLSGLHLDEVIVPALGGQVLDRAMPAGTTISYKYPFWWNAQFVLGAQRKGGWWLRMKDEAPRFKLLRVRREESGFSLTLGFEATAPLRSNTVEAEWFLDTFDRSWREPVAVHRQWLAEKYNLLPLAVNPLFPSWASSIDFVLEMWGVTKEREEPLHTFATMERRLREWKRLHPPERTLVYLPGFAEHGIDSHAPDYHPGERLGGARAFKHLVGMAHRLGYRVMVHTNVLALTFTHALFKKLRRHIVVDPFGREQGWALDMDGDWLAEPYFAYVNPGAKAWGDVMEKVIGGLIRNYGVDGVFLDQTLLAFNVSRGPNFVDGMRRHILRLQRAFPGTLFAGEGMHEEVIAALPMAQIHGIDSLTEVHGIEGTKPWRHAHPVSTELFGPYTRFVAHLLTKHPSHPMFRMQEKAYAGLRVLPALCLYNHRQAMQSPAVARMIRRAGRLRESLREERNERS